MAMVGRRLFVGGVAGAFSAVVSVLIFWTFRGLTGQSSLGTLKGPGTAAAAVLVPLILATIAGLLCGAIGGALGRPFWGSIVGTALFLAVLGGFLSVETYIRNAEVEALRQRLLRNQGELAELAIKAAGNTDENRAEDLPRIIETYIEKQVDERARGGPRTEFSLLGILEGLLPCAAAGFLGGWCGRRIHLQSRKCLYYRRR